MPAKLLYRDAQGADASVDIPDATPIFLGRGADCAVRTDDALVSRKNCKLSFAGGRYLVEDLGSSNGTYVNERRVQKQQLNHSDVIRCGSLQVRFVEVAASRPKTAAVEAVRVEPGVDPAVLAEKDQAIATVTAERDELQKSWKEAAAELETLRARAEANENELKSLRQQAVTGREEIAKVRKEHAQDKEELVAVNHASEELRDELRQLREEHAANKTKLDEQSDELAARDRQLERAQEDVQRTKQSTEELRNKLLELQKTKDEGWNELNKQLSQIDQLREVITEQERILEERRVGLIALEAAVKDHRSDKEKVNRELADVKNQRDDLKERWTRAETKVEGLEEEHRRLARMMATQAAGGSNGEDFARMAAEVRELKIENKKLEQQVTRLQADCERLGSERSRANEDLAHIDVERNQLAEERKSMEAARDRAEDRLARAEAAKAKLDEEKQQIAQARDTAMSSANDVRHLHDRALRRIAELEKQLSDGGAQLAALEDGKKATKERDELRERLARVEARLKEVEAERDRLRGDLETARAAGVSATSEDVTPPEGTRLPEHAAAAGGEVLRAKAQEVYDGINEALSSLRTTMLTAKGLFGEVAPMVSDEDARKALGEAISDSMARTEDAKGTLRGLRELLRS